jgi:cell division protein FtsQ
MGVARGGNRKRVDPEIEAATRQVRLRRAGLGLAAAAGAVALGLGGLAGWQYLTHGALFRIREVRFSGNARVAASDLLEASPVHKGDNLFRADLAAERRALGRLPWVRRVEVRRRLPAALEARVEEYQPAALVELGGLYLVSREGEVFKRAAAGDGLDLPVITGIPRDDYVQRPHEVQPVLTGALALTAAYAQAGLAELAPLSEIHFDADRSVTLYVGAQGTEVRLGSGDLPQKLGRLKQVLATLAAANGRPEVLHLDNRTHPSWVTVRLAGAGSSSGTGPRGP